MDATGTTTDATPRRGAAAALLTLLLLLAAGVAGAGAERAAAITFTTRTVLVPGSGIGSESGLAVADFDEDGDLDLAVSLQSGDLSVLLRDAAGGYAQAPGFPRALGSSYAGPMKAVDLDGDGHLDLVAAQITDATSYAIVLLGDGAGGFGTTASIPLTGTPGAMAVADVTGDGRPDLVLPSYLPSDTRLLVMPGDGAGGFGAPLASQPLLDGTDPAAIVLADLDRDGDLDAAVGHVFSQVGVVSVLRNDGAGGFARVAGSPFDIGSPSFALAGGDVDGDGRVDLVAPVRPASRDIRTITAGALLGDGSGGFGPGPGGSFVTPPALNPVSSFAFPLGDLDGDGLLDGAISTDAGDVWPLFGDGAGRFQSTATAALRTAAIVTAGTIADVDGDGVLDVVVTSAAPPARVFTLINDAEPAISAPGALDLGAAQVGAAPASATVRISNPGDHGLRVSGLTVDGADAADFAAAGCLAAPILAGASCDATVTFAPHAAGARAATLRIASDAPGAAVTTVALTGTATPAADTGGGTCPDGSVPPAGTPCGGTCPDGSAPPAGTPCGGVCPDGSVPPAGTPCGGANGGDGGANGANGGANGANGGANGAKGGADGGNGAPPHARAAKLALALRPARRATLAPGRRLRLTVTLRNSGTIRATAVTLCPRASAKRLTAGRCRRLGTLVAGRSVRRTLTVQLAEHARRGRLYTLTLTAKARGARAAVARLRVRAARVSAARR